MSPKKERLLSLFFFSLLGTSFPDNWRERAAWAGNRTPRPVRISAIAAFVVARHPDEDRTLIYREKRTRYSVEWRDEREYEEEEEENCLVELYSGVLGLKCRKEFEDLE